MKDSILELRKQGKSYKQIKEQLGCSLSTISFHCSTPETKAKCKKKKPKEKVRFQYDEYIKLWKEGKVSGGKGDKAGHGFVSSHVRRYLFEKNESKCTECGWSETNQYTKTIPLEVEHIDGNPMNHKEENLTLLCPNCHSLTAGHSSAKGNGRRYYRQKYKEEVGVDGFEPPKP